MVQSKWNHSNLQSIYPQVSKTQSIDFLTQITEKVSASQ